MNKKYIRVLLAKIGLDGHDRGAKVVSRALRDAGLEVIYAGIRQSVESVTTTAIQEDVPVIGLSFLAGDHMTLIPKLMESLRNHGREDIDVIVGGIILPQQVNTILDWGVRQVFLPGTPTTEIVDFILDTYGNGK